MSGDVHVQFCERPGVRFPRATHLVILIDGYRRWRWLEKAVYKRLLEELATLDVELNRDKTRRVDLAKGESFTFLGFNIRRAWTQRGKWGVACVPRIKARTKLLRRLKEVFRRRRSQPVERVIALINPILRGWTNYFRIGQSSRCFSHVKDWVEQKVRRLCLAGGHARSIFFGLYFWRKYGISLVWSTSTGCPATIPATNG